MGGRTGRANTGKPDGLAYSGEWKNGFGEGLGHLVYPDGSEYEGLFRDGKPQGAGRLVDATGETFSGPFVDGLKSGRGTTTLPNGQSYLSDWLRGTEIASSRQERLSHMAAATGGSASPDIRLAVRVLPVRTIDFTINDPYLTPGELRDEIARQVDSTEMTQSFGYAGTNRPEGIVIVPANKRRMAMWKGNGPVGLSLDEESPEADGPDFTYGVFSIGRWEQLPVNLALEVQNRGAAPIQIVGIYLDVADSVSDLPTGDPDQRRKQPRVQRRAQSSSLQSAPAARKLRVGNSPRSGDSLHARRGGRRARRLAERNGSVTSRPRHMPISRAIWRLRASRRQSCAGRTLSREFPRPTPGQGAQPSPQDAADESNSKTTEHPLPPALRGLRPVRALGRSRLA